MVIYTVFAYLSSKNGYFSKVHEIENKNLKPSSFW